ncbi:hypothetical protein C8R44DRAFT_823593 [Mycena epipterygia]|nr:hypothetical protein C8R44DRAFT_823593 [Mycena epipterygia]
MLRNPFVSSPLTSYHPFCATFLPSLPFVLNGSHFSALFALCITVCAFAASLHRRQTGDLQCNIARLKIISRYDPNLDRTTQHHVFPYLLRSVLGLTAELSELSTASAVDVAQAGLNSVDEGIQAILTAIFNNQTAPASSRDQVWMGLAAANDHGVSRCIHKDRGIFSTTISISPSANANATVTEALATLASTVTDGNNVVSECK